MRIRTTLPEDKAFPLLPEGPQLVKVKEVYPQDSKAGKPMVVFQFESIPDNVYLRLYTMNEGENRWMLKKVLHAITGQPQAHGEVEFDTNDLIGKRLSVIVEHEDYNGKKQAKVKDVVIPKGDDVAPGQESFLEDDLPF